METPEVKKQKLIAQLIAAVNRVATDNTKPKADYIVIADKNIESIAKKFNVSKEVALELLKNYFAPRMN